MVAWSTRQRADELPAPCMLLALDAMWRDVDAPAVWSANPPRQLVFVDGVDPAARRRGCEVLVPPGQERTQAPRLAAVITQDVGDQLGSDLGQVVRLLARSCGFGRRGGLTGRLVIS